jgi:uncharacterized protein DUF5681
MTDEKKPSGDYEIGYGKPPPASRFKPGQSGNPKGRPKQADATTLDITGLLNEPIKVKVAGKTKKMSPFEASFRLLAKRAIKDKNLGAIIEFLKRCEEYSVVKPPRVRSFGGVVHLPRGWDQDEWIEMLKEHGPPPWPGDRPGVPDEWKD